MKDFNTINGASNLNWDFGSQLAKFIRRFWINPYKKEDTEWIQKLTSTKGIKVKSKLIVLKELI